MRIQICRSFINQNVLSSYMCLLPQPAGHCNQSVILVHKRAKPQKQVEALRMKTKLVVTRGMHVREKNRTHVLLG